MKWGRYIRSVITRGKGINKGFLRRILSESEHLKPRRKHEKKYYDTAEEVAREG